MENLKNFSYCVSCMQFALCSHCRQVNIKIFCLCTACILNSYVHAWNLFSMLMRLRIRNKKRKKTEEIPISRDLYVILIKQTTKSERNEEKEDLKTTFSNKMTQNITKKQLNVEEFLIYVFISFENGPASILMELESEITYCFEWFLVLLLYVCVCVVYIIGV